MEMDSSIALLVFYLFSLNLVALLFVMTSVQEKEQRAAGVGALFLGLTLVLSFGFLTLAQKGAFDSWLPMIKVIDVLVTLVVLTFVLPIGRNPNVSKGTGYYVAGEVKRVDERDIIFARIRSLRPGKPEYDRYYQMHPELKEDDDKRRGMGGPLGIPGKIDSQNRPNIGFLHGMYNFPQLLGRKEVVCPKPVGEPLDIPAGELTKRVKGFAKSLGANLVGITKLNPLWMYSHKGEIFFDNWEEWGKEINTDHPYAIVVATEMNREMIMAAPHTPATIESTSNYSLGAYITVQLASFLADLGYQATANHFRNYEVNCVPLAVDAGLGELGRNGYLITKEFGPRIRLAVVTTNAPLETDSPVDLGVQHFCEVCKKCADLCPSGSIPKGNKTIVNGSLRWKLDAESCSAWWARLGTDCCICMAVCPWSHPDTLLHKMSRFMARRSAPARYALTWADDLFYGRYKGKWYGPEWCDYRWPKGAQGESERKGLPF